MSSRSRSSNSRSHHHHHFRQDQRPNRRLFDRHPRRRPTHHRNACHLWSSVSVLLLLLLLVVWNWFADRFLSLVTEEKDFDFHSGDILPPRSIAKDIQGNFDASVPRIRSRSPSPCYPTHHACDNHSIQGVLHIAMGDIGGAAGTIFFQLVIGQLLYAERYHLKPWIHFNNVSYIVYDPHVHATGPGVTVRAVTGVNASMVRYRGAATGHWRDAVPGPLERWPTPNTPTRTQTLHFAGTGVWSHYFAPVSDFCPGDISCQSKYYVTLGLRAITPGIHGFAPWATRAWRYHYLPDYISQPHVPLTEWLEPQRQRAARTVQRYIRVQPYLRQAAERANPGCTTTGRRCLGLHIRHSDKAAGRRKVATAEFLPFALAFVHAGGQQIYLATDSQAVLEEIRRDWPPLVTRILRTMDDKDNDNHTLVVRSTNEQAVFDLASHHRTNQEILIEIVALSHCHFLVHGLSAVSESSIWMNLELHATSVNLEDDDHLQPAAFGTLVQMVSRGEPQSTWPRPIRTDRWWEPSTVRKGSTNSHHVQSGEVGNDSGGGGVGDDDDDDDDTCKGFDGVLHIANVGKQSSAGAAFFTDVLNQLLYAEMYNLKPWVHLQFSTHEKNDDIRDAASYIYDASAHGMVSRGHNSTRLSFDMLHGMAVSVTKDANDDRLICPGRSAQRSSTLSSHTFAVTGNGVWNSYFEPVSDFVPGDPSCHNKPLISMEEQLVSPVFSSLCPWAVRAWRYDIVPDSIWWKSGVSSSYQSWIEPMRRKAHQMVQKYYRFRTHIIRRADKVNPSVTDASPLRPCLAVHLRNGDKTGKFRSKVTTEHFLPYFEAFVDAGGQSIYVASDSSRALQFIENHFPRNLSRLVRTQGSQVVRTAKDWPTHLGDSHHRVNSETLVDILALSRCQLLLHTHSTVSEAAIYLNLNLHNNSVNLEDPERLSPVQFRELAHKVLRQDGVAQEKQGKGVASDDSKVAVTATAVSSWRLDNATIVSRAVRRGCRRNAVVYLAQKKHSSYGRDSYNVLLQSLSLLTKNYLSLSDHLNNTNIFIFHNGDFDHLDLQRIESLIGPGSRGAVHFVDLSGSRFWARPKSNRNDDPSSWYAYPLFSEGYRRMMHWYAIDIWQFFKRLNDETDCGYRYIFRLDEDSFIHSTISYDIFEFFRSNQYVYGFRLCAYEMQVTQRMWTWWKRRDPTFVPQRDIDLQMCGFYNNLFVADLEFFQSDRVKEFLDFIDFHGHIYRRRLGDLMIHTMAVLAFAPPERIHRFLDFTYEHGTENQTSGCLAWGGIQAGYNDPNASTTLEAFYQSRLISRNCQANATFLHDPDLSPSYAHVPDEWKGRLSLHTIVAGRVDWPPGKGILSG